MKLLLKTTLLLLSPLAFISCTKETAEVASEAAATEETATAKPYPLDVCLVSGEKLGSMGEPVSMVHEGQEIKFCCDSCPPKFKKDPAKYLGKLKAPSE
jgi:YHS domain-containing protein